MKKTAIIIGAGPAGLTAAYELLIKTDIKPIIFEETNDIGGISKTHNHKGNRMDMGGHRFFSKSQTVMDWWINILPLQGKPSLDDILLNSKKSFSNIKNAPDPEKEDKVMLLRNRLSRIYFLRKFFDYPISLSFSTLKKLGFIRVLKIGFSYIIIRLFPIKEEKTLEDFMINRFGKELYLTFFKDYTKKVWGEFPDKIKPDWGSQRIKGISVIKIIQHAIKDILKGRNKSLYQNGVETSLIEQFIYPKYGPGHLWNEVASIIKKMGGEIYFNSKVINLNKADKNLKFIKILDKNKNEMQTVKGDYFISSMPVKDLIGGMNVDDESVKKTANGLIYRDFITVGLLVNKLNIKNDTHIKTINDVVPDLWMYIQERDVKIGRLQIYNNWSPYLVKDFKNTVWLGLEYFATEGDELWTMPKDKFINFAIDELEKINIIKKEEVIDKCLVKVPKAYPAYFGTYDNFNLIVDYVNKIDNLFLIGRNGMHRYNNMDHSMLTAIQTVDNIINNNKNKKNIWEINTESDYHEDKK